MTTGNGDASGFSIIAEKTVPDVYADSVAFEVSVYGVSLEFGKTQKPPPGHQGKLPSIPRVRVHMSPQHAKVMALMLMRNVAIYEKEIGKIAYPEGFLKQLGFEEDSEP